VKRKDRPDSTGEAGGTKESMAGGRASPTWTPRGTDLLRLSLRQGSFWQHGAAATHALILKIKSKYSQVMILRMLFLKSGT